jgi:hypothetical protein
MNQNSQRYEGQPLLRLLECYVLWSIGELPEKEAQAMEAMAPKLRQIYEADGTWQDVIATVMELPPNMPQMIRDLWTRNSELARTSQMELSSQTFAEMFVDANLA